MVLDTLRGRRAHWGVSIVRVPAVSAIAVMKNLVRGGQISDFKPSILDLSGSGKAQLSAALSKKLLSDRRFLSARRRHNRRVAIGENLIPRSVTSEILSRIMTKRIHA